VEIISFRNSNTVTKLVTNPKFITDKKKMNYRNITMLTFLSSYCNGFMLKENYSDCDGWKCAALRSVNREHRLCFSGTVDAAVERCLARLAIQISTWKVSKWSKIQECEEIDAIHPTE
jgi:hypothetical protein